MIEQSRLKALEDKLAYADFAVRELEQAVAALQTGIVAASRSTERIRITPPPPLYPVTSGVLGCSAFQDGISVSILASDGHTYGPVLTASGGAWTISVPAGPATITFDPSTGTTYQQRFTGGTQSYTVPATGSSPPTYVLGIAAGYECFFTCTTPIKTTLNGSSAACGAFTLAWNSGTGDWDGTMSMNIPAQPGPGTCPAVTGATVDFRLVNSGALSGQLLTTISENFSTGCPDAGGPQGLQLQWSKGTQACGPVNLVFTRPASNNAPWCNGWNQADTITITE